MTKLHLGEGYARLRGSKVWRQLKDILQRLLMVGEAVTAVRYHAKARGAERL